MKIILSGKTDRGKIINNLNDFVNESVGLISISGEDSNFAKIIGLNMTAGFYLGYNKSELLNRKINMIMPHIIAELHDNFLDDYLNTLESKILNTDRLLMGRVKNGYITPLYIYIRYVPSFLHGT